MHIPGTRKLYVYLDVENYANLTLAYWQGWAYEVNYFQGTGTDLPFYAGAYLGSLGYSQGNGHCSTINGQTGLYKCYAMWSNQPNPSNSSPGCSAGCSSPGPSTFYPYNCSGVTTQLWQYGDAGVCQRTCKFGNPSVDLDSSNPSVTGPYNNDATDYMIYLA